MKVEPLSETRFQALRASVERPHLNYAGLQALGIDVGAYDDYTFMRGTRAYSAWLATQNGGCDGRQ